MVKDHFSLARAKEIIREFGVNFVKDLPKEKEQAFIERCISICNAATFEIVVSDTQGCKSSFSVVASTLSDALKLAAAKAEKLDFE